MNNKSFFLNHKQSIKTFAKNAQSNDSKGDYSLADRIVKRHIRSIASEIDRLPNSDKVWRKLK